MGPKASIVAANAIIWAGVLIATAILMQGAEHLASLLIILGGAGAASILITAGALRQMKERK